MFLFSAFLMALALTMALIPPLIRVAERLSVMDVPNERKVHTGAIPRIGGMAMVVGVCVPIFIMLPHNSTVLAFLSALLVILVFGAWDDSKDIDYRLKFLGQFIAVFLIVFWGDVRVTVLPFSGMETVPAYLSLPITVLFLVGVTNAVNLSDGLDGLAAGVTLLSLGAIALLAKLAGGQDLILACFVIAGAIFGFLRYNTYPASIFMGDTGSQFLGFTVGVLSIMLTQQVNTALNPWLPLFLVGLPIVDTLFVMIKRICTGRSPFVADKNHMHYRLLALGLTHYEAVSIIYIIQLGFLLTAISLRYYGDFVVLLAYSGLIVMIFGGFRYLQCCWPDIKWSLFTKSITQKSSAEGILRWSVLAIKCGVPAYLMVGALQFTDIPADIALSSFILLVVLVVRLSFSGPLRFLPLRLLVFPAIAFAVYAMYNEQPSIQVIPPVFRIGLPIALLLLILIVIRLTKDKAFQTTPTDLLVIALAGGVGVLYQQGMVEETLVPVVLSIIVFFYAAEVAMRHMRNAWNCFTLGMVAVLALLSFKML